MFATNVKIALVVIGTLAFYTLLANMIPQIQSEVPEQLSFAGEVTVDQLMAAGEQLYEGAGGCTTCHGLGTRAPNLLTDEVGLGPIGARCGERVPGEDCKEYLYRSLTEPNAHVVAGYEPIMPAMGRTLSEAQIWALIAFLQSQGGEITVTPEDVQTAQAAAPAAPAATAGSPAGGAPAGNATADPLALLRENQCLVCHTLKGEGGPIGPPFDGIGTRLDADRIRRSILEPNADTARGYEAVAGTMPATFGNQLTAAQLETIVRFLARQK